MGFFEANIEKMRKKRDVAGLKKLLFDKDPCRRKDALEALFCLGLSGDLLTLAGTQKAWPFCDLLINQLLFMPDPKAIDPLVAVLADSSCPPGTAKSAVQTLDKLGWQPVRIEDAPPHYMRIKILEYIKNGQHDICVQIGEPAIPILLELLRNNRSEKADICSVLKKIGEAAVEPLISAVDSNCDNGYFNTYVVQTLGQINHPRVMPFFMNMLGKNVKFEVREEAIVALGNYGRDAVSAVDTLLNIVETEGEIPDRIVYNMKQPPFSFNTGSDQSDDSRPGFGSVTFDNTPFRSDIRISAILALGKIGDSSAVDSLIDLYNTDWNHYVRIAAIRALAKIDGPRAVNISMSLLNGCLKINNEYLRERTKVEIEAIVETLGYIKDSRGVDLLVDYFKKIKGSLNVADALVNLYNLLEDPDKNRIREALFPMLGQYYWAAIALGKIGDERAIQFLIPHLGGYYDSLTVSVIVKFGLAAIPFLVVILRDHPDSKLRSRVVCIIGRIKDARALEALSDALKDKDRAVRTSAALAIKELGESSAIAVSALIACLSDIAPKHEYDHLRGAAAYALGKIGDPRAVDALLAIAGESKDNIGETASYAVGEIGMKSSDPVLRMKIKSALKMIVYGIENQLLESYISGTIDFEKEAKQKLRKAIGKILIDLEADK